MKNVNRIKIAVFFTALGILAVIGLAWFRRPAVSELEKRELASFPELTLTGLMDGSFGSGVDKWYSDTYPLREALIGGANRVKSLYGNRTIQIINNGGGRGDDIPDTSGDGGGEDAAPPDDGAVTPPDDVTVPPDEGSTPPEGSQTGDGGSGEETTPPHKADDGGPAATGEVTGPIFLSGDTAYGLYYFNRDAADRYAEDVINKVHDDLLGEAEVYTVTVPTSSGIILNKATQDSIGVNDQYDTIEYTNSLMDPGVHALNIFDALDAHDDEYIYFRTDHHWTALGAYYAYVELCREMGVTPHTLDQFEKREYPGFLGSFYSTTMAQAMEKNPDTVDAYVPMGTNSMVFTDTAGKETNWYIISDATNSSSGGKYYCFSGSDQPYAYAHNPQITDGSACVVIKDSFGNAFVPFLVDHYEYVYWIDFRYYEGTLQDLVREKGIGDVIFCINVDNISDRPVGLMKKLVGNN